MTSFGSTTAILQMRKRLGDYLVETGLIDAETLQKALDIQKTKNKRLGEILIDMGAVDDEAIAKALAEQLKIPLIRLQDREISEEVISLVPSEVALAHLLIPVDVLENKLIVAMVNPLDRHAIEDLRFLSRMRVEIGITTHGALIEAFWRYYPHTDLKKILDAGPNVAKGLQIIQTKQHDEKKSEQLLADIEAPPIVRLTNTILADAFILGASDIHVQPRRSHVLIRYRIDGIMQEIMKLGKHLQAALVSRLKVMATMDISIRMKPQDGKTQVQYGDKLYDLRIATIPTSYDERVNIRILDQSQSANLKDLGLPEKTQKTIKHVINRPQGIILVTGPTGSGKSTTLYACLSELNSPSRSIMTVEDPVEYDMPGIDQVEINPKVGLTFATGLRSILRHDPDIVMVGEIRDNETASIAFQAGMTGHLIFSTLHTNDALSAISRLVDLGVEPFVISNSLLCVVGQRLIRKICQECKERDPISLRILEQTHPGISWYRQQLIHWNAGLNRFEKKSVFWKGKGCEHCRYTGYSGRIGIFEILMVTPALRELIASKALSNDLREAAEKEGFASMCIDGMRKTYEGATTIEEIFRVSPPEEGQMSEILSAEPVVEKQAVTESPQPAAVQSPMAITRPQKILVVDDDEISLRVVRTVLETANYQVITAQDGESALKLAIEERPDLIISDLIMPEMDGIALTRKLKSKLITRFIPVILLTAKHDVAAEVKGLESGADDFLTKPIHPERVIARVKRLLDRPDE